MKTTEQKVPALRFPEFEGEWEKNNLEELTNKIGDGLHSTPIYTDNSGWYFINGNNLLNGKIAIDESTKQVDIAEVSSLIKDLNTNTILISINGTIGNLAFYNNEQVILGKSACYMNYLSTVNKFFVYNTLQTDRIKRFFFSELTGTTIKNLSLATIRKTVIFLPSSLEQQKIADFLSATDKRLELLKEKKRGLEDYKRGAMQRIFSQELRFTRADGSAYEDWEEKKLGEVLIEYRKKTQVNNEVEILTSSKQGLMKQIDYYGDVNRITNRENIGFNIIPPNYITYRSRSDDGIFTFNLNKLQITGAISVYYPVFTFSVLNNSFFVEYANHNSKIFSRISVGTSQRVLSLNDVKSIKLSFPSLEEQTQIANFLSVLDLKIEKLSEQIEATENYKKGLLQQMFV